MTMRKAFTWLVILAGVSVLLAIAIGRAEGARRAKADKERLEAIWPTFMSMPADEKGLIVESAYECGARNEPADKAATIACLRQGAFNIQLRDKSSHAVTRLEELLARH